MKDGHQLMKAWDKTWRHGHIPMWMKKAVRKASKTYSLRELGMEIGSRGIPCYMAALWDHRGSILRNGERIVLTQPYERNDAAAEEFARRVGCQVEVTGPGPWHPETVMYSFYLPNVTVDLTGPPGASDCGKDVVAG